MTLALVVALPLGCAALVALAGGLLGRRGQGLVSVGALGLSAGACAAMIGAVGHRDLHAPIAPWLPIEGADLALVLTPTTLPVALMVAGVATLIAIYSLGYLAHDAGTQRYFAAFTLFVAAMQLIVLADNLLLLFAGWELVGVCSYLLIGHWRERPAAAAAAVKAFVVNRVGDAAFLIGIFLALRESGTVRLEGLAVLGGLASLLLLVGAVAKSAQLPLHTWLPDAMEGPTPVSALIHAATMVTAGVVLLVRLGDRLDPLALGAASAIGAATALFASVVALAQWDHKRVLAWSTISQVGLMFVAAGAGAAFAAVFHLLAHAFFKAALFLGSGSILHGTGDELDMRRLGGLLARQPATAAAFAAGLLALAAIPPASGFFSKEAIAVAVVDRPLLLAAVLATTFVTALYSARAYALLFLGVTRSDAAEHARESGAVMLLPLGLLAFGAVAFGLLVSGGVVEISPAREAAAPDWLLLTGATLALGGVLLGVRRYGRGPRYEPRLDPARGGFGVDLAYGRGPVRAFGALARALDAGPERATQGAVDLAAAGSLRAAGAARLVQSGSVRAYEAFLLAGTVAILAFWALR